MPSYLIIKEGEDRTSQIYTDDKQPEPGVEISVGYFAMELPKEWEHRNPNDFILVNNEITEYVVPPEPEPVLSNDDMRRQKYDREVGSFQKQLDTIHDILLVLAEGKIVPDKDAPVETKEGWLGKIEDIKEQFPKDGN